MQFGTIAMIDMDLLFALPLTPLAGVLAWKALQSAFDQAASERSPAAVKPKLG